MRSGISITVTNDDRRRLERVVADRNAPQKHVCRARIVQLTADGLGTQAIMRQTGTSKTCVWRWQERFMQKGADGLLRDKTRKPGHAPVALKKGRGATITHDYKRNGTTTPFAALNVLTGEVFGQNKQRHRATEFIHFLNALEREIPAGKVVHVVLDSLQTHRSPKEMSWLERTPRWIFHVTPTSASWLNAAEGFFAKLTKRRLKHGVFHSLVDLQAAINRFITEHNEMEAKPFTWRAKPDQIIAARKRGFQMLESIR